MKAPRKFIQIAATYDASEGNVVIVGLCDDGTVWIKDERADLEEWHPIGSAPLNDET